MTNPNFTYVETDTGAIGDALNLYVARSDSFPEGFGEGTDQDNIEAAADANNTPDEDGAIYVLTPIRVTGVGSLKEAEQYISDRLDGNYSSLVVQS